MVALSGRRAGPLTRPTRRTAARVWRVFGDESAMMDKGGGEFVSRLGTGSAWGCWPRFLFLYANLSRFVPVECEGERKNPGSREDLFFYFSLFVEQERASKRLVRVGEGFGRMGYA